MIREPALGENHAQLPPYRRHVGLPGRLGTLYSSIRGRAPQAKVVAAGYPRIFNGEDCNLFTWFSPTEESRLNATADLLNAKIKTAASAAGFGFSNPNRPGHASGYAPLVGSALTGSAPVAVTALTVQRAEDSARGLQRQQRAYAAQDRTIRPTRFQVPDLQRRQIKQAAARAGVDLRSRASIDAADRRYAARQAATAR